MGMDELLLLPVFGAAMSPSIQSLGVVVVVTVVVAGRRCLTDRLNGAILGCVTNKLLLY